MAHVVLRFSCSYGWIRPQWFYRIDWKGIIKQLHYHERIKRKAQLGRVCKKEKNDFESIKKQTGFMSRRAPRGGRGYDLKKSTDGSRFWVDIEVAPPSFTVRDAELLEEPRRVAVVGGFVLTVVEDANEAPQRRQQWAQSVGQLFLLVLQPVQLRGQILRLGVGLTQALLKRRNFIISGSIIFLWKKKSTTTRGGPVSLGLHSTPMGSSRSIFSTWQDVESIKLQRGTWSGVEISDQLIKGHL